ncbi:tyrosine-type recombinase/integrase [Paludisphaera soli]|uniref:tyrosine-type recombinase/integrase n=1 Tax=Paludisphaera soli TaxID=2712865 RepID=UPI0013EDF110|nr:tyrosine-type recombinase/integrase [Paludisphaera soli]
MASLQERDGRWQCQFLYRGKRRTFALGRVTEAEAKAKADQVDYLLMRVGQGLIALPPGVDVVAFVKHDGSVPKADHAPPERDEPTLADLRDRYLETHGNGTLEANTLRGVRRHFKHLTSALGERFPIRKLTLLELQGYVDRRSKAKGRRGQPLNPATIKKEIVTLRTAWNWGVRMKIVSGRYPYEGLRYPKTDEKPPFQNRDEILRQLPGLSAAKADELWESLYLTLPEIERLLAYVESHAAHLWIHPLVAAAAHTGARKGELLKMRVGDVDLVAGTISIQERKRAHGRRTTRRVPLSTALAAILRGWLAVHPGGTQLFAHAEEVRGSKKRSPTTGHLWKDRPGPMGERLAGVRGRERPGILPLTEFEVHHHVKRTLKGSEWEVVRGLHCLRHSFISAMASKGVDQRIIDEVVGHQSEEQRRRYRHLYPATIREAVRGVFG